jgi:hypothetical protein
MNNDMNPFTREAWLVVAVKALEPIFSEQGFSLPKVRVSCAFPSTSRRGSVVGQCWGTSCSTDGINEIFITPLYSKHYEILDTLTHELVHAVDDCQSKHGKEFKRIATAIGLEGKMINASAGPQLKKRLQFISSSIVKDFGYYPHAAMCFPESQSSSARLNPRAVCPKCGFQVTVSTRFIKHGPPICPRDKTLMEKKGKWVLVETND